MATKLKLGIIGMSEGNGHPYSWSAIFNGYNSSIMANCPFPSIPEYLAKEKYPENFLSDYAKVTHIWSQDLGISEHIAKATFIKNVCKKLEDMLGHIDAVLLARDDAENHFHYAKLFLTNGIPIYIDKPFALNESDANALWDASKYNNQIFTCSALQFASEFNREQILHLGNIKYIWATVPKSWEKYAVHIIEPVLKMTPSRGKLLEAKKLPIRNDLINGVQCKWSSGMIAQFQTFGPLSIPLSIKVLGENGYQSLIFKDSYNAFKRALFTFIKVIKNEDNGIQKEFTMEMVKIVQNGIT